ncbi:MAG: hypothetical protein DA329_00755, partial [Candidatus Nitrosocosmicus sp.]|nr:hypothetical protein [Candidatus Nitrosocosmicus sp.]
EAVDIAEIRHVGDHTYMAEIFDGISDDTLGQITLQTMGKVKGDSFKRSVEIKIELTNGSNLSQTLDVMEKDNDYLVYKDRTRSKEYP